MKLYLLTSIVYIQQQVSSDTFSQVFLYTTSSTKSSIASGINSWYHEVW